MNICNRILMFLLASISFTTAAVCTKVTSSALLSSDLISKGYTAGNWAGACDACTGNLGLPSVMSINTGNNFQPAGSIIASTTVDFVSKATSVPYSQNQILYRCDAADANSLFELYSTHGNSNTGNTLAPEIDGAYYDGFANTAFRIRNLKTGEFYSRFWKERKLTSEDWILDGNYIYIPANAFSDITYEVFKVQNRISVQVSTNRWLDSRRPRGYIAFKGPGLATNSINAGTDSASSYPGWPTLWVAAWGTARHVTWVRGSLCQISDYQSVVLIPTISSTNLKSGVKSQAPFKVSVECENGAISGTNISTVSSANVALGFLVNQSTAIDAAMKLGLTSSSGLTHLLDTNYGATGVASGVGIRIYNENGLAMNLLSSKIMGTGNLGGWYAYKDIMTNQGELSSGLTSYTGTFLASLESIPGEIIKEGTVNAQLQVIISFQ